MKLFAKQSSSGDGRVFRSGVWSAAIAAAVIVLAVLVNLIVRAIPSRYTEFDLSEAGLYTLSESSRQVADDLTQDVTIYYLAQTGNEDQIISKLLDKYAAQSSHITWELKDPAVYPTFAAQYGAQDLTSGGLILVCGEQSKVLDAAELYDYDYSDYAATGAANVTFDGESRITSAIYQLTSGESRHVYYTTNHGEQALTSTLTDALESQNLTVSALDLLSQTIPEDCDLLVINDPAQDFSGAGSLVDELGQLRSYLSNGGRVLLLTDSYYSTPNLDAVMAEFGLTRTEGPCGGGRHQPLPQWLPGPLPAAGLRQHGGIHRAGRCEHQPQSSAADGTGHHPDRDRTCGLGYPSGQLGQCLQQTGRLRDDHHREGGRRHCRSLHAGSIRPQ